MVMRIKVLREAAGISQGNLAAQMGVSQSVLSNWETEVALPKSRDLPRLANVLGVTIDELYEPASAETA